MDYTIDKANEKDKLEILEIYQSLIGEEGCTWNDEYPNLQDVEIDIANGDLFCLKKDNKIIAVTTLGKNNECENEFENYKNIYSLQRVAVHKEYQGEGYATILLKEVLKNAKDRDIDLIYLLVNPKNKKAINLYKSLDFQHVKNIALYDLDWELMKKEFI